MTGRIWCRVALCPIFIRVLFLPVQADLIVPAITHVYFEMNGTPYNGSVDYSVKCYGYFYHTIPPVTLAPGTYQPELVYQYSAHCGGYGCAVYPAYYYKAHVDRCDVTGTTGARAFTLQNFSDKPYSRCDWIPERSARMRGNTTAYYYDTPEYSACRQFESTITRAVGVDRISFSGTVPANTTRALVLEGTGLLYGGAPLGYTVINKTGITMDLHQYVSYLETCDPATDQKCPGWIVNDTPLKTMSRYRPLMNNAPELEESPCDTFLVSADPSLIMPFTDPDPWHHPCIDACNFTYDICASYFVIPSENSTLSGAAAPQLPPNSTTVFTTTSAGQITEVSVLPHSPVHRGLIETLYCRITEFFGGVC
jgi:hypothetical protein